MFKSNNTLKCKDCNKWILKSKCWYCGFLTFGFSRCIFNYSYNNHDLLRKEGEVHYEDKSNVEN